MGYHHTRYGGTAAVFLSPAHVAQLQIDDLRSLQVSHQKAQTLLTLAPSIDEGSLDVQTLYHLSSMETRGLLQELKGIRPWTADYSLLRVFGHGDVFLVADVGLRRAWAGVTNQSHVTTRELLEAAQVWAGRRSEFAFWLWLSTRAIG